MHLIQCFVNDLEIYSDEGKFVPTHSFLKESTYISRGDFRVFKGLSNGVIGFEKFPLVFEICII